MPRVGKSEHPLSEFQGHIHMHAIRLYIRPSHQLLRSREPQQVPIESKVQFNEPAVEFQKEVFSAPPNILHAARLAEFYELSGSLRLCTDRMKNVHASDALAANKWSQRPPDGFYFRKFRHGGVDPQGFRMSVCFLTLASAASEKGP